MIRGVNKEVLYEQVRIKSIRQTINEVRKANVNLTLLGLIGCKRILLGKD